MSDQLDGPFHDGELEVQERAGVRLMAARTGRVFRTDVPDAARDFLEAQPWVVIGGADIEGLIWASVLVGRPGFARVLDSRSLVIDAEPDPDDPLLAALVPGNEIGLLGIELATRRRMRVNGQIAATNPLTVRTEQVYSNCPKYIQARDVGTMTEVEASPVRGARELPELEESERAWIESADTFFMASRAPGHGADVSHRGGEPGFVRVEGKRLSWPDYAGNMMFNTLGNLARDPRAGLVFLDFDHGRLLHLSGRATIDWSAERIAGLPGAERVVDFEIDRVVRRSARRWLRFGIPESSPFNPPASPR